MPLRVMCPENRAYFCGNRVLIPSLSSTRAAETLPIRWRQSKERTPLRRERVGAARCRAVLVVFPRAFAFASVRLCRSLLSFPFHLASPVKTGFGLEAAVKVRENLKLKGSAPESFPVFPTRPVGPLAAPLSSPGCYPLSIVLTNRSFICRSHSGPTRLSSPSEVCLVEISA
jgi:hypothetical protein